MAFAIRSSAKRWKGGVVPFVISPSLEATKRQIVRNVIATWNRETCVQFVDRRESESDFVEFVQSDAMCQSPIGRQGGRQEIRCTFKPKPGLPVETPVSHEVGHAIGLHHEHKRPDRDQFVIVSAPVLEDKSYKLERDQLVIGPYDCQSLMHYTPISGEIWPHPDGCQKMGGEVLSDGDRAAITQIYRFRRRGDSRDLAGTVQEIVAIDRPERRVLTAVRTSAGNLRLIAWRVNANGSISREDDSANDAGKASSISMVVINDRALTAVRTDDGNLRIISWNAPIGGAIERLKDSADQAGRASHITIRSIDNDRFITAVRQSSGALRLIAWRLNSDGSFDRLQTTDEKDEEPDVSEIALAVRDDFAVTAVRASNGRLKLIHWHTLEPRFDRLGDSGDQGEEGTLIRIAADRSSVYTSLRDADGRLRVIAWRPGTQSGIARDGDSGDQGGHVTGNALARLRDGMLVSAVRTDERKLRLMLWNVDRGAIAQAGDSGDQAGEVGKITVIPDFVPPVSLPGLPPCVTAVQTGSDRLRLIAWETCAGGSSGPGDDQPGPSDEG